MINTNAVVLGRNYTSLLGMIRAAGAVGCNVTVIKTVRKKPTSRIKNKFSIDANSKYVKRYEYAIEPDRIGLINMLLNIFSGENDVILLPTDDFTASTIDMYQERLADKFKYPNIRKNSGKVIYFMDKNVQKRMALSAGLNVAKGWISEVKNGVFTIPDGIQYPVFTKPQISFQGDKTYMKRCDNQNELESVLKKVASQRNCSILIEQFIKIEKEYGVLGYCGTKDVILPSLVKKDEIGHGGHQGVTMFATVYPMENYSELQQKLRSFLKDIGFHGLVDIDLYECNGKIYFNELNMRLGAFGFAAIYAGINMPEMFIKELLGYSIDDMRMKMTHSISCVSEKVCLDDYEAGYIDLATYKNYLKKAEWRLIRYKSDMAPYRQFKLRVLRAILRKVLRQ